MTALARGLAQGNTCLSQPGFLGDRFLSLSLFYGCTALPHGGAFFTHCGAQLSGGTFAHVMRLSWESLRWKTPNKVRPVAEACLFSGCSLCACSPWLPPSGPLTLHPTQRQRTTLLDHLFGEVWDAGRTGNAGGGGWGLAQHCGIGPQIPGELVGRKQRWTLCSRRLS